MRNLLFALLILPSIAFGQVSLFSPGTSPAKWAIKVVDESATNDDVLSDDTHLFENLVANSTFYFKTEVHVESGSATPDYKFTFSFSVIRSTIAGECFAHSTSQSSDDEYDITGYGPGAEMVVFLGAGEVAHIDCEGIVETTEAGTFSLQWSQNTSNGTATTMQRLSFLKVRDISRNKHN